MRRRKKPKTPPNWDRIETLMRIAVTGGRLRDDEQKLLEQAYWDYSEEYGERHVRIKKAAVEQERRRWAGMPSLEDDA